MGEHFEQQKPVEETEEFKAQKRQFFVELGLNVREALKMHKEIGLWGKGKDDWRNVSEHCLVEVARAEIFADKLGLPESVKKDLVLAAALHDFFKKEEKKIFTTEGMTWDSYKKAEEEAGKLLNKKGFNEHVIRLVGGIGAIALGEIEDILKKENLSEEDIAFLVLHYIDDYTSNDAWVKPSEIGDDQKRINDLDRRLNNASVKYKSLGEEGKKYFNEESPFSVEIRFGHLIEKKIAKLLKERSQVDVDPLDLPELIDNEIHEKIRAI